MEIHDEDDREDVENYQFKDWQDDDDAPAAGDEQEMIKCPSCRKLILEDSPKCPYCKNWVVEPAEREVGKTTNHKSWVKITAWILIIIAMLFFVIYGMFVYNDYGFRLR